MKILAETRLTVSNNTINAAYLLYKSSSYIDYDLILKDYKIDSNSFISFAHEKDILELLVKYWLKSAWFYR